MIDVCGTTKAVLCGIEEQENNGLTTNYPSITSSS